MLIMGEKERQRERQRKRQRKRKKERELFDYIFGNSTAWFKIVIDEELKKEWSGQTA